MKILITGIAGFIGYHLAKRLSDQHEVVGVDNFNTYYSPVLKHARADMLIDFGVKVEFCDLRDISDLDAVFNIHKPDYVIHLAAYAGVRHSLNHGADYIENNIVGTQNLIDTMKKYDVKNVIYASTSCVMAGNKLPWVESDPIDHQLNPYGFTKACNESQFLTAQHLDVAVGLRFFTVYGPWGRPDMALYTFTDNIAKDKPITLFNNGAMVRDFTYIDDIINGIEIILENSISNQQIKTIYNIGYGEKVPLMRFVDAIEKNLNKKAIKEFVPKHPADTQATWSDTTKLQKLGYKPSTPIEKGVEKFVSWYKYYHGVN